MHLEKSFTESHLFLYFMIENVLANDSTLSVLILII